MKTFKVPKRKISWGEERENERLREKELKKPRRNYTPQRIIDYRKRSDEKTKRNQSR